MATKGKDGYLKPRGNSKLTSTETFKLTPADKGILSAVFDDYSDCGDDDTVQEMVYSLIRLYPEHKVNAYSVAYDFFRMVAKK